MNNTNWKDIEQGLRAQPKPLPPRDSQDFWAEFRARAELAGQGESGLRLVPERSYRWQWAAGVAAALVLLLTVTLLSRPSGSQPLNTAGSAKVALVVPPSAKNEVKALDVYAEHSGVMVLQGDDFSGTIVWITGLTPEADVKVRP